MSTNKNHIENIFQVSMLVVSACSGEEKAFLQRIYRLKDAIYFGFLKWRIIRDTEERTIEWF